MENGASGQIIIGYTVEPPNKGQVGALTLVPYSEVSFIGRFSQKSKFLFVELFFNSNYDQKKLR